MKQYLTKKNVVVGVISLVLLAIIIVSVVMQLGSKIPVLTLDYELTEKESGLDYVSIPIDWRGGTKAEKEKAKIAKEEGYAIAMTGEIGCVMNPGKTVEVSFEEKPKQVLLYRYDQSGNPIETISLDEQDSFVLSNSNMELYVIEATWDRGTCAYGFWVMTL